jgi:hypothetical protein
MILTVIKDSLIIDLTKEGTRWYFTAVLLRIASIH